MCSQLPATKRARGEEGKVLRADQSALSRNRFRPRMTIGDRSLVESGVIMEYLETEFCRSDAQPLSVGQHLSASQRLTELLPADDPASPCLTCLVSASAVVRAGTSTTRTAAARTSRARTAP